MGTKYYYYTVQIFNQENTIIPLYAKGGAKSVDKLPVFSIIRDVAKQFNTTIDRVILTFAIQISKEDYYKLDPDNRQ